MKKLYKKGTVHPSPPLVSDHLSFLPAAILTLAAALSPEDREVLAYLISCSSGSFSGNQKSTQKTATSGGGGGKSVDHPPSYSCNCFRCYKSYWVRWDSSPNRHLIHEIIDAFEDGLAKGKKDKNKKERRKRGSKAPDDESKKRSEIGSNKDEFGESESVEESSISSGSGGGGRQDEEEEEDCVGGGGGGEEGEGEGEFEKGSVRKFVSFLGEKFWGVWN